MTCQDVEDGSQFEAVSKAGLRSVHKGGKNAEKCVRNSQGDLDALMLQPPQRDCS